MINIQTRFAVPAIFIHFSARLQPINPWPCYPSGQELFGRVCPQSIWKLFEHLMSMDMA